VINWSSINSKLLLAFLITGMGAAFWEFVVHGKLTVNAQDAASEHGAIYDSMFTITLVITGIVFVITQVLLFWYGYKYKADGKRKALYYPDNHKIEFIWTIIPAVVLTILVIRGLKTWNNIMNHRDPKATVVEVFGYQFGWTARYAGLDNKLGNHDFRQIGVVNALGVDPKDPKSQDDIMVNELHFEAGKPVSLKFRAKDVIHSAYLPHFRVQMNVVPGLPTQFNFTPTITTSEMRVKLNNPKFDYILLCNKICGGAHYRMKMKVVVDSPAEYAKWLKEQPNMASTATPAVADSTAAPVVEGPQASLDVKTAKTLASK
jgi:cytochrome c oxidase subunit 2